MQLILVKGPEMEFEGTLEVMRLSLMEANTCMVLTVSWAGTDVLISTQLPPAGPDSQFLPHPLSSYYTD